jgi:CelD/BcsL family acetyltransferase involved in cellulose biosynthesis
MEFKLHTDFSSIPGAEWNALAEESLSDSPFARHEYLSQWWQTRGGGEWKNAELALIAASENHKLTGLAPLFIAEHGGRSALLPVGSIEISDYLDLIVRPPDLQPFLSGLFDFLDRSGLRAGRVLDWYNLPEASPTLAALRAESETRGLSFHEEIYRPVPRIPLNGSFEEYLSRLDKKQRHELRRKMRRAAEHETPVRFRLVQDSATLDSDLGELFQLMARDENKAGFLTEAMRAQLSGTLRAAFQNGYLWLGFLEVGGVTAAASVNFDYRNKLWGYNSGVNRDFTELSPGWVLLGHVIQWACEHGRYEFDFMRGDEEYKYRLGGVNRHVLRVVVSQP